MMVLLLLSLMVLPVLIGLLIRHAGEQAVSHKRGCKTCV